MRSRRRVGTGGVTVHGGSRNKTSLSRLVSSPRSEEEDCRIARFFVLSLFSPCLACFGSLICHVFPVGSSLSLISHEAMKVSQLVAALAAICSSTAVDARLVARVPQATRSVVLPADGMSPKPTVPPSMHELLRRQDSTSYKLTMAVAPDNTCGYISGNASWAYTCGPSATCGLVFSQPTHSGLVMCYNDGGSNFRFGCMDYNDIFTSSKCGDACAQDTLVLKWYALLLTLHCCPDPLCD